MSEKDSQSASSSQPPQPQPPPASRLKVTLTILFHSTCAISAILISKSALTKISLPITLLTLQTFVAVCILCLIGRPLGWIKLRMPSSAWRSLFPLTLARLVGVLAKTYCLAVVNASFYQIARGLLLPFTLLLSFLILRPRPRYSNMSMFGCGLVMTGFGFGMMNDWRGMLTSTTGVMWGIGSSFTTAVESVTVKKFMSGSSSKAGGMWQMIYMTNCMALGIYLPLLLLSGEYSELQSLARTGTGSASLSAFLPQVFLTGFTSFLLTLATFLQISVTSPTTHMIVTAARGVAQSILAVVFLGEKFTSNRLCSMAFILTGSAVYGYGKEETKKSVGESGQVKGRYEKLEGRDLDEEKNVGMNGGGVGEEKAGLLAKDSNYN